MTHSEASTLNESLQNLGISEQVEGYAIGLAHTTGTIDCVYDY